jgi:hypothetical protein
MKLKSVLFLVAFAIGTTVNAQEVKIKKEIASIDGKEYVRVGDCGMFATECSIRNLEGEELIIIKSFKDEKNPGTYFQLRFVGTDTKIELKKTIKPLIKLLYENKVVTEDGRLNLERVKVLLEKYGNQISAKK